MTSAGAGQVFEEHQVAAAVERKSNFSAQVEPPSSRPFSTLSHPLMGSGSAQSTRVHSGARSRASWPAHRRLARPAGGRRKVPKSSRAPLATGRPWRARASRLSPRNSKTRRLVRLSPERRPRSEREESVSLTLLHHIQFRLDNYCSYVAALQTTRSRPTSPPSCAMLSICTRRTSTSESCSRSCSPASPTSSGLASRHSGPTRGNM